MVPTVTRMPLMQGFPPHNLRVDAYSCQWFHGALHITALVDLA